uniref:Uncharacterized protein n=1 Tax=Cannabis sativa TaxID=3483 RepID=A0A803R8D1_CANSA
MCGTETISETEVMGEFIFCDEHLPFFFLFSISRNCFLEQLILFPGLETCLNGFLPEDCIFSQQSRDLKNN